MNTCEKCGNQVPVEKAFCPNCGAAMIPERQRMAENLSEELGPTMYGYDAVPDKLLPTPPLDPSLQEMPQQPSVQKTTQQQQPSARGPASTSSRPAPGGGGGRPKAPAVATATATTARTRKSVPASPPVAGSNRTLNLILGISAALFALSILAVVILYFMGKL
jgi:hypothetical protein